MSLDQTRRCCICGAPYKIFSMMVGDQSACRRCVAEAERQLDQPTEQELEEQAKRRRRHFGRV